MEPMCEHPFGILVDFPSRGHCRIVHRRKGFVLLLMDFPLILTTPGVLCFTALKLWIIPDVTFPVFKIRVMCTVWFKVSFVCWCYVRNQKKAWLFWSVWHFVALHCCISEGSLCLVLVYVQSEEKMVITVCIFRQLNQFTECTWSLVCIPSLVTAVFYLKNAGFFHPVLILKKLHASWQNCPLQASDPFYPVVLHNLLTSTLSFQSRHSFAIFISQLHCSLPLTKMVLRLILHRPWCIFALTVS